MGNLSNHGTTNRFTIFGLEKLKGVHNKNRTSNPFSKWKKEKC